jgi:hypothetical protein
MAPRENLLVLARRAEALGDDHGTPDEIVKTLGAYRALAVRTVIPDTRYRNLDDLVAIYERFACEVRPAP